MSGVLPGIYSSTILAVAISKLRKMKTNDLAITKGQIWLHLGSFFAFTSTSILLLYSLHAVEIKKAIRGPDVDNTYDSIHGERTF